MSHPVLSDYALCELEDVKEHLGYDEDDTNRDRTMINNINAASRIISRRAQRDFIAFPGDEDPGVGIRIERITTKDVQRNEIRLGDMQGDVTEVKMLSPDRDVEVTLEADAYFLVPDVPEAGMPFTKLYVKRTGSDPLIAGYWLSVDATWGFPEIPADIRFLTIATAAEWVISDILKRTEMGEGQGAVPRHTIPRELEEIVDSYRTFRVA